MNNQGSLVCTNCRLPAAPPLDRCPSCGGDFLKKSKNRAPRRDEMSVTVKVYTGIFVAFGLLFPFFIPIILKVSHANL